MVREERDENFLGGVNWLSGSNLNYCIGKTGTNGCKVDGRDGGSNFDPCTSCNNLQGNNVLRVDESTGEYGYSGGSPSRFYRYVQIQETDSNQGAIVTVRVGFDTGRYIQEYVTRDYLRNWSPR